MPKPDLDGIIQSPEAETFLDMVTRGFYDNSYTGLWMYEVIGREWDEMRAWSEALRDEMFPQTCTWSIAIWEWVYGIVPDETLSLEIRRQRILSRAIGVKPINPEVLRVGIVAVSGTSATVEDFVAPYTFHVALDVPKKFIPVEVVQRFIYDTKPSHLAVSSLDMVFPGMENILGWAFRPAVTVRLSVPEATDDLSVESAFRTGGKPTVIARLSQMQELQDS